MDSIVTARVPSGIKAEGLAVLKTLGATPTDLVNSAYRFVISEKRLPFSEEEKIQRPYESRKLSPEQVRSIRTQIADTTFDVPASFWNKTDEEMLQEALEKKYACAD